jgi:hypothetical protein
VCSAAFVQKRLLDGNVPAAQLAQLETDENFLGAMLEGTPPQ